MLKVVTKFWKDINDCNFCSRAENKLGTTLMSPNITCDLMINKNSKIHEAINYTYLLALNLSHEQIYFLLNIESDILSF